MAEATEDKPAAPAKAEKGPKPPRVGAMVTFVMPGRPMNGIEECPAVITQIKESQVEGRTLKRVTLTIFPPMHSIFFDADVPHESEINGLSWRYWRW